MTGIADVYGLPLTTTDSSADAYNRGVGALLRVQEGGLPGVSASITHDPTFALGHAAMALLGYEYCAPSTSTPGSQPRSVTPTVARHVNAATCTPSPRTSEETHAR